MPNTSTLAAALRGGLTPPSQARAPRAHRVVVAGGAGPLGAAVLERLLGGHFGQVAALVQQPMEVALRGLEAWPLAGWQNAPLPGQRAETAVVVFDRERSRHGREDAFVKPQPGDLPALSRWLREAGVTRLLLVLPQSPALLPQALRAGLASVDEHSVAMLGFEHLVIVRPSRPGSDTASPPAWLARLGVGLLAQLHWMLPQNEQPLRPARVGEFVAALAAALPQCPPGTRVAAPELLWNWAQPGGGDAVLQAWLHGRPAPLVVGPLRRW